MTAHDRISPAQIATVADIQLLHSELVELKAMLARLAPAQEWTPIAEFAAQRGVTVRTVNEWAKSARKGIEAKGHGKLRVARMMIEGNG